MTSKNEREVPRQNQQIPQGYPPSGYPPPDFYAQHGTPPAYSYPAPAGYAEYPPQQQGYPGHPNYYQGGVMAPTLPPGYYNQQQQPQQQASGWLQGCLAALCCCCMMEECFEF
ncbi:uncharacterized protein [Physcomitrium patens]|uniref:uncharacterized protein isoform X3 n=1 Tax=Physcomitrium patens TaxID=3218 RepID=UPI000D163505|nr:cysteine-rich and transmembrane domain-containing protein WIH2-like isoform X2 [Physcomitrium patens]|eukprot:XP_024370486.1 cysteine-rich and transmembrane domain-containing protein WIH2-like isoform X2 [Physcomitrella patens]